MEDVRNNQKSATPHFTEDTNWELVTIIIKNLDECKSNATEKHSLSGGTASANLVKKTTLPSGSSARAIPPGVSHFSSALCRCLFKYDEI